MPLAKLIIMRVFHLINNFSLFKNENQLTCKFLSKPFYLNCDQCNWQNSETILTAV